MTDTAFHFSDDSTASTLADLAAILRHASSDVTAKHVTPERNDYALWVRHVHHKESLADEIQKCRTPSEVADVIEKSMFPPAPKRSLTPLKEKLRAIAPKPMMAHPSQEMQALKAPSKPPEHTYTPVQPTTTHEVAQQHATAYEPPEWTPSTPLPEKHLAAVHMHNPHVRDFLIGLVIGIVIGVVAYNLLLQVI